MIHKKRAYFFVLDAALGIFVLAIGAFLIASLYINLPEPSQVGLLSDDFLNFLSNTQIKDLNNPYAGIGGQLWKDGSITNKDNSLLQFLPSLIMSYGWIIKFCIRETPTQAKLHQKAKQI